jgi:P4 family phage/plasmid primase-like protien
LPNLDDFPRLLTLLGRDNDILRLCMMGTDHQFRVTPIPAGNAAAALEAVLGAPFDVWFEVNPTLYTSPGGRSSAPHITRLAAIWADLDFKPAPGGMGSLPAAMSVVDDLSAALGIQPSAIVQSGHGIQPYWPVSDGEVTVDSRDRIATLLKRWGVLVKQFAAAQGGDADSVFDLPRILRVPGSVNHKDAANPAETSAQFYDSAPVDIAWLTEVLDDYGIQVDVEVEVSGEIRSAAAGWEWADVDCQFAVQARQEIVSSVPHARHQWALKWAGVLFGMVRGGCITEATFYDLRDALTVRFKQVLAAEANPRPFSEREFGNILNQGQRWAESWSEAKLSEELRRHTHDRDFAELVSDTPEMGMAAAPVRIPEQPPTATQQNAPASNVTSIFTRQQYADAPTAGNLALNIETDSRSQQRVKVASLSDVGNAEKLSTWLRGRFIFVPGIGWHEWNGARYIFDTAGSVVEASKDLFVAMRQNAEPDSPTAKWAMRSLSAASLASSMKLAQSVHHLVVEPSALDAQPYEMNTPGGIIDLRTSVLRAPDPLVDFHTLTTAFTPDERPIPRFMQFLGWAMNEPLRLAGVTALNPFGELAPQPGGRVEYLQHLFGVAAIGELRHHIFPIFLGVGANGKSALLDMIAGCFGDYAAMMPARFLIEKRGGEAHPTEIAQLRGVRLAINNEVPPSSRLDEEMVKRLTGESTLRGRYMGKDFFQFPNIATQIMAGNHPPTISAGGYSLWRRLRKITFGEYMPVPEQNPTLANDLLREEGPGILRWIIGGAAHVIEHGLVDPPSVIAATSEYEMEENTIGRFISECLVGVEGAKIHRETAYQIYDSWIRRQNQFPVSATKFGREMVTQRPTMNLLDHTLFAGVQVKPGVGGGYPGMDWTMP